MDKQKTRAVLGDMTEAEVIAFLCSDDAETYANAYSHDELIEELIRLGREGTIGYGTMSHDALVAEVLDRVDPDDAEADEAMAEHVAEWLRQARENQK